MSTADESSAKARGLFLQFENGSTYLALRVMHPVGLFQLVDSLSRVLQASDRTVSGAIDAVQVTLSQLQKMRCDEYYAKIWDAILAKISEYNLNEIKLPRHMRPLSRFEQKPKAFESHRFDSPEEFYRVHYFSFIDAVICNITDRFAQPDVKLYAGMETVVTGACRKQDITSQLDDLCCKYDDFDKSRLTLQLRMLPDLCPSATMHCL